MGDRVVLAGLSGRRVSALQGRRAVVTGGTKGAGAAIVARLRSAGAHVTAVARQRRAGDDLAADDFVAADLASDAGVAAVAASRLGLSSFRWRVSGPHRIASPPTGSASFAG